MSQEPGEAAPTPEQVARDARTYRLLDLVVAAFFVLIGGIVLQQAATDLPVMNRGQVGPGMLPFGVGCILVAMGATVIVQNLRGSGVFAGIAMPTLREGTRVAAVVAMLILSIALMPILGTLVSLVVFIFLELRMVEGRSWLLSVSTALLVPLFIYLTFEALLGVALPAGIIGLR